MQLKYIINSEPDEELSFIAKFWVTGHQDQELLCFVTSPRLIISFGVGYHIIHFPTRQTPALSRFPQEIFGVTYFTIFSVEYRTQVLLSSGAFLTYPCNIFHYLASFFGACSAYPPLLIK